MEALELIKNIFKKKNEDFNNKAVDNIGNALPDMMWAKSIDGKYLWANQKIIDGLLFSGTLENTLSRTDQEMADERRKIIGEKNHTFGLVCGNSDYVVLEKEKPERFLEFGLVTGENLYLEVHKDILLDSNGKIIGTVGTGRDITEEYTAMKDISNRIENKTIKLDEVKTQMDKILNKYYFKG